MSTIAEAKEIAKRAGKTVGKITPFKGKEDFEAVDIARDSVKKMGLKVGTMCGDEPMGLAPESFRYIAKWKNINSEEYVKLNGVIVSENFRNGADVIVVLFNDSK